MENHSPFSKIAISLMTWAERIVVLLVGVALFVVAAAFVVRTFVLLPSLFTAGPDALLPAATAVLNNVLLVLMLIELAYTVMLSLRGIMLAVEPFLIVGLIATVRRVLVITIGEGGSGPSHANELYVLIALLLALVVSIVLLNLRTRLRSRMLHPANPAPVTDIHQTSIH